MFRGLTLIEIAISYRRGGVLVYVDYTHLMVIIHNQDVCGEECFVHANLSPC